MASNSDDATDSGLESDQPSAKTSKMDESSKDEQAKTSTQEEEAKPVQETNNQSTPVAMVTQEGDAPKSESAGTSETVSSGESQKAEGATSSPSDGAATAAPSSESQNSPSVPKETVNMKLVWNKKNYDVTYDLDGTVSALKAHIETITGVPPAMQKLMYKGLMKDDDKTLRQLKVTNRAKLMLVGSTITDVLEVTKPVPKTTAAEKEASGSTKEPLSKQKQHKKVLDKGKPEDAMLGIKNRQDPLPSVPISGMYNKSGGKVRLTFKLEVDQLWIGTKERTEKVPMTSIKNVSSEPIEGHEDYHILFIQLGPTEASRYWLYWVPAQYTTAIKDAILGKWQYF